MSHRNPRKYNREDSAEFYNEEGDQFFQEGRLGEAEARYKKAVEMGPKNYTFRNNLGVCLYAQGKYEEAEPHFRQAVKLQPVNAEFNFNLGLCLFLLGNPLEADMSFYEATKINPHRPKYYKYRAEINEQLGYFDLSVEYAKQALRVVEENPDLKVSAELIEDMEQLLREHAFKQSSHERHHSEFIEWITSKPYGAPEEPSP